MRTTFHRTYSGLHYNTYQKTQSTLMYMYVLLIDSTGSVLCTCFYPHQNTAGLGRMWLKQMGEAALRYDLTIQ